MYCLGQSRSLHSRNAVVGPAAVQTMILHVVNSMNDLSLPAATNVECNKSRNAIPARLNSKDEQQSTSQQTRTAHIQADYTGHAVPIAASHLIESLTT